MLERRINTKTHSVFQFSTSSNSTNTSNPTKLKEQSRTEPSAVKTFISPQTDGAELPDRRGEGERLGATDNGRKSRKWCRLLF